MDSTRLPEQFLAMLAENGLTELGEALATTQPCTSVRLNRYKGVTAAETSFEGEPVGWCADGIYLDERPRFTFDPRLHQGCYYVQEASSMFHSHIVRHLSAGRGPLRVLDACAAPGGKTTAAIDALPAASLVVANEYVPSRAAILRENIIKWSYPDVIVTRGDTAAFRRLKESFDIIIADVPCSGEGMMRKDEEAVAQWSPGLVRDCAERQWEIVSNLWQALKPGGELIYSTCTFNRQENEMMIERIISEFGAESVEIPVEKELGIAPGIATDAFCYRFMPHLVRGEGLFAAVVRKAGEPRREKSKSRPEKQSKKPANPLVKQCGSWLTPDALENYEIYAEEERVNAFPRVHIDLLKKIKRETDVIHEGVLLCNIKGRDLIPSQSLALSPLLDNSFPKVELDYTAAISYLSGETVSLPEGTPRGFVLLTYSGRPLGFVKNIGNRSNNLYPAQWRIKSKLN